MSLQNAILGLLTYGPITGYQLKSVFDEFINHFWSAQLSQIYRDLGTLERKGCVSYHIEVQEGRPNKKIYSITEKGRKAFQEWLEHYPRTLFTAARDEICVRIFFGSRLSTEEVKEQLQKYKREVQEQLAAYQVMEGALKQMPCNRPEDEFFWRLTLKKGILLGEACIQWTEECIKEMEQREEI